MNIRVVKGKIIPIGGMKVIAVSNEAYEGIHRKAEVINEYVQGTDLVIEYRPKKFQHRKHSAGCKMILHDLFTTTKDNEDIKLKVVV